MHTSFNITRSFFGRTTPKTSTNPSKTKSDTPTSKAEQSSSEKRERDGLCEAEREKEEPSCSGADSPVFKKRCGRSRKRVIFESDEEEEVGQSREVNGSTRETLATAGEREKDQEMMDGAAGKGETRDTADDTKENGKTKTQQFIENTVIYINNPCNVQKHQFTLLTNTGLALLPAILLALLYKMTHSYS